MFLLLFNLFLLTSAPATGLDSLMTVFEKSRGRVRTEIAARIFKRLDEEQITDSLIVPAPGIHPDSLAVQVYYWAGEKKMAENDFAGATPLFEKAAALASGGKNRDTCKLPCLI